MTLDCRCYHARIEEDKLVPISVISTFDHLVVPGTIMWIKPRSVTWETFKQQFPRSRLSDADDQERMLQVRLNIPVDQVKSVTFV